MDLAPTMFKKKFHLKICSETWFGFAFIFLLDFIWANLGAPSDSSELFAQVVFKKELKCSLPFQKGAFPQS